MGFLQNFLKRETELKSVNNTTILFDSDWEESWNHQRELIGNRKEKFLTKVEFPEGIIEEIWIFYLFKI